MIAMMRSAAVFGGRSYRVAADRHVSISMVNTRNGFEPLSRRAWAQKVRRPTALGTYQHPKLIPRRGFEHPHDSPGKTADSEPGGAESGAPSAPDAPGRPIDADLRRIIDAWPDLPPAIRPAILAMVEASALGEE